MKHIKKFEDESSLISYKKSNFVTPHVYLDANLNEVQYMETYIPLEYISSTSTGGQYIDLGCQLLENTDDIQLDIKFNITGHGKSSTGQSTLIASQIEINPYPGFTLRGSADNPIKYVELMTKWMCSNDWISFNDGGKQRYCYKYIATQKQQVTDAGGQLCSPNEIHEYSILLDQIPASQVNNTTCTLFCALNGSNQPFRFITADLYYLKITKGGQVIRNLIPVKRVSTQEVGLYDIENDHLYTSQGDSPFVAGPINNI